MRKHIFFFSSVFEGSKVEQTGPKHPEARVLFNFLLWAVLGNNSFFFFLPRNTISRLLRREGPGMDSSWLAWRLSALRTAQSWDLRRTEASSWELTCSQVKQTDAE